MEESDRRRAIQQAYNEAHGITPHTVNRGDQAALRLYTPDDEEEEQALEACEDGEAADAASRIERLEREMREAAARLDFETAAVLRDRIKALRAD